jgi:MFS family permease
MDKIEFYKNRSLGERFSAATEFIRQNWKVLYRNILIVGIPIGLVQGYFMQNYFSQSLRYSPTDANPFVFFANAGLFMLMYMLSFLTMYAIAGAIMSRYESGLLSKETRLKDLGRKIFSNIKKIFLVSLAVGLILVVAYVILLLFIVVSAMVSTILTVIVGILFFVAFMAIIPPMVIIYFPAVFQGTSIGESVRKGFRLGFKNWGSTFGIIMIVGLATGAVSAFLSIPYMLWMFIGIANGQFDSGIVSYCLSMLSSLAYVFVTPLTFVFLAFHYFSIVEKEEGISLQSKVEDFENL